MDPAASLELNERERLVLSAIVRLHIEEKVPVGSKTLVERLDLDMSAATVRNVMAALSEKMLIHKPHKSAGRVPTDRGLRFFVDSLLEYKAPPEDQRRIIERSMDTGTNVERAMDEAGRVLATLAQKTCLIRTPREDSVRMYSIELVELRPGTVLVILVTESGLVQNRLLELPDRLLGQSVGTAALQALSQELTGRVRGRTLSEARAVLQGELDRDEQEKDAWETKLLQQALAAQGEIGLKVEGGQHLADATLPDGLKRLYAALEEKSRLLDLLDSASTAEGVRIFIGEESGFSEFADLSVVTATYGRGASVLGSIGVIGPQNMDYGRVVPLVTFTADAVSRYLGQS